MLLVVDIDDQEHCTFVRPTLVSQVRCIHGRSGKLTGRCAFSQSSAAATQNADAELNALDGLHLRAIGAIQS